MCVMQPGLLFLMTAKLDVEIAASQAGTGTERVRACARAQSITGINLWWLRIWTEVITIWDEGFHLYPGSEWNAAWARGRWERSEETEANEDGWSHRSEQRGFKMFKAFGLVATRHRGSWVTCGFYMWREAPRGVCCSPPNLDRILLENKFSLPLKRHRSSLFSLTLIYLETSLFPSLLPAAHLFSSSSCPSLSVTPGQVCPCVASPNRKCIMDVTFLPRHDKVLHTPLFRVIMKVRATW